MNTELEKIEVGVIQGDEYQNLIEECKGIITEGIFKSNWVLVEAYHGLGNVLRNFKTKSITKLVKQVSQDINKSERTLWWAVQFYDKCPELKMLPYGKEVTWRKIVTQYLPGKTEEELTHFVNVKIDKINHELLISRKYEDYKILFV